MKLKGSHREVLSEMDVLQNVILEVYLLSWLKTLKKRVKKLILRKSGGAQLETWLKSQLIYRYY